MPFTPLGYDHIVLRVKDQEAAKAFYVGVLGCSVDHVNEKLSLIHLRFGDHMIDLVPGAGAGDRSGEGIDHFCLSIRCDNLQEVAAELKKHGVPLDGEVTERRGAYGYGPSLYVRDPDGYKVELKPR
jgi:glyoxylase I family protein